jgi:hypothetical protein
MPPLNPENTGSPTQPSKRKIIWLKAPLRLPNTQPDKNTGTSPKDKGTVVKGSGTETWEHTTVNTVNKETRVMSLVIN